MTDTMSKTKSICDLVFDRAATQATKKAFIFLDDGEQKERVLTYGELGEQVAYIAASFQAFDIVGERVLLVFPPGINFLFGFLAALCCRAIAIPAFSFTSVRGLEKLRHIARDASIKAVLSTKTIIQNPRVQAKLRQISELNAVPWLAIDDLPTTPPFKKDFRSIQANTPAYLQYTSGATSSPKGVVITHENILHNSQQIQSTFRSTTDDIGVIWLPHFHDMGLIGGLIQPLYVGFPTVLMSPFHFVQKPIRWLQAISKYRGSISGGANFGFDLCLNKINADECKDLDLSSWRVAFSGGEPIKSRTLDAFSEKFAAIGFRKRSFLPCYGLAEATLIVSGCAAKEFPKTLTVNRREFSTEKIQEEATSEEDCHTIVSVGAPVKTSIVKIVDVETFRPKKDGEIGEVWVHSKSVANAYWNKTAETEYIFDNQLDTYPGIKFLRTGDLGFFLKGQLYITGRKKNLIIIRGMNLYPHDLENYVANSHTQLKKGCGTVFSNKINEEEHLVVVQEVKRDTKKEDVKFIMAKINATLSTNFGVRPYDIALVIPHSLPKTSSGKIMHYKCKQEYLNKQLKFFSTKSSLPNTSKKMNYD